MDLDGSHSPPQPASVCRQHLGGLPGSALGCGGTGCVHDVNHRQAVRDSGGRSQRRHVPPRPCISTEHPSDLGWPLPICSTQSEMNKKLEGSLKRVPLLFSETSSAREQQALLAWHTQKQYLHGYCCSSQHLYVLNIEGNVSKAASKLSVAVFGGSTHLKVCTRSPVNRGGDGGERDGRWSGT